MSPRSSHQRGTVWYFNKYISELGRGEIRDSISPCCGLQRCSEEASQRGYGTVVASRERQGSAGEPGKRGNHLEKAGAGWVRAFRGESRRPERLQDWEMILESQWEGLLEGPKASWESRLGARGSAQERV